jgi:hypothetical protein
MNAFDRMKLRQQVLDRNIVAVWIQFRQACGDLVASYNRLDIARDGHDAALLPTHENAFVVRCVFGMTDEGTVAVNVEVNRVEDRYSITASVHRRIRVPNEIAKEYGPPRIFEYTLQVAEITQSIGFTSAGDRVWLECSEFPDEQMSAYQAAEKLLVFALHERAGFDPAR